MWKVWDMRQRWKTVLRLLQDELRLFLMQQPQNLLESLVPATPNVSSNGQQDIYVVALSSMPVLFKERSCSEHAASSGSPGTRFNRSSDRRKHSPDKFSFCRSMSEGAVSRRQFS